MSTIRARLVLVGLLALAGCTRTEDYVEVVAAQQQAMQEVTAILAKIQNEQDMAAARDELQESYARYDAIQRRANALPKPPPPEVASRIDGAGYKQAFEELQSQVRRVHGLPGGGEFLDNLKKSGR
jgi:hypothetical protein